MMKKNEKLLLAHCTLPNRKLQKDLIRILTLYNLCIVELMEKMNISVSLPLKLSGTLNDLMITDSCNYSFKLHLLKNIIILEQDNEKYHVTYSFNVTDFSIEFMERFWIDGVTTFSIDSSNSIITCKSYFGDTLLILFDQCIELNKFLDELVELCTDSLNDTYKCGDFDITKIKGKLKSTIGCEAFYIAIESLGEPA